MGICVLFSFLLVSLPVVELKRSLQAQCLQEDGEIGTTPATVLSRRTDGE